MRESYRRWHRSAWLNERLDEMHADIARRERRYRLWAGWTFLGFVVSFLAMLQWPIQVGGAIGTIGFWSAMLLGGICWYTWNRARIERSLMDMPLELYKS